MPRFSRTERAQLCDLLGSLSPAAPTLCSPWTTYALAAHLVLRERHPVTATGIVVPALAPLADRAMRRLQDRHGYDGLVELVRSGPPKWSPFGLPGFAEAANVVEMFVHHEDVRRALPGWSARDLDYAAQSSLWGRLRAMGRVLARRSPAGLGLVRTDSPDSVRVKSGEPPVVLRGLPSELLLFCFGRQSVAEVELEGDQDAVAKLRTARLGW